LCACYSLDLQNQHPFNLSMGKNKLYEAAKDGDLDLAERHVSPVRERFDPCSSVLFVSGLCWHCSSHFVPVRHSCLQIGGGGRLLGRGKPVDAGSSGGATPLMAASKKADKKMVKLLLKARASVDSFFLHLWLCAHLHHFFG
jgi:hypothetical protein